MSVGIRKALKIRGWMGEQELRFLAGAAAECKTIVELGTYRGRSTRAMLDCSSAHIWCVDTWNYKICTTKDLRIFKQLVIPDMLDRVTILQTTTMKALKYLRGQLFDMVFIDAGHSYGNAAFDIVGYRPLVKPGGILCGHDYHPPCKGVYKAVNELVRDFKVEGLIWWKRIPLV